MGGKRRNLWALLLIAVIVIAVALVLYVVGRSPEQRRNDLGTYLGLAAGLIALAAPAIIGLWRQRKKQVGATPDAPELDQLADQLALAVEEQWEKEARERKLVWPEPIPVQWSTPSAALAGPVTAAVRSTAFDPLPGLRRVEEQDLRDGGDISDLHAMYGGLGSGRLVIAGAPGSGKSGAAVLLIRAALRHRDQVILEAKRHRDQLVDADPSKVPVPVMFTLHGWDPGKRDIEKWLAARLQRTYPALFPGKGGARKAASLLTHNKVTVILDGLDEIAEKLRPAALRALSAQAEFRVVLICRSEEMVAAVQEGMLDAAVAVELQPVGPKDAAQYLTDVQRYPPPTGWAELTRRLDEGSDSALAQALCSPLALTLVRDTYRSSDNVHELIDISNDAGSEASMQRIEEYLLDRVLPAAYEPDEGKPKPRYAQQAESAFHYIASKMSENKTTDLQWWLIPDWAAYGPRVLMTGVAAGLVTVLWVAIAFVFLGAPIIVGLFLGVVGGIVAAVYFGRNVEDNWEWAVGPPPGILPFSGGGIRELAHWFDESSNVKTNPLTPKASWRSSFIKAIVSAPFIALFCGLVVGGVLWALEDNPFKVSLVEGWALFGLIVGVAAIPAFALTATPTWPASLAFIELRFSQHTPIRLMRFLEDARQRGVLRMVGPVYQFRHAHLQDRLAEQASPPALSHDASEASAV